jgi:hypothetical protein
MTESLTWRIPHTQHFHVFSPHFHASWCVCVCVSRYLEGLIINESNEVLLLQHIIRFTAPATVVPHRTYEKSTHRVRMTYPPWLFAQRNLRVTVLPMLVTEQSLWV